MKESWDFSFFGLKEIQVHCTTKSIHTHTVTKKSVHTEPSNWEFFFDEKNERKNISDLLLVCAFS